MIFRCLTEAVNFELGHNWGGAKYLILLRLPQFDLTGANCGTNWGNGPQLIVPQLPQL